MIYIYNVEREGERGEGGERERGEREVEEGGERERSISMKILKSAK